MQVQWEERVGFTCHIDILRVELGDVEDAHDADGADPV